MGDPDYSTWATKQDAARRIGCSTKTVEKLARDGAIQQARWHRTRGPAMVVFHPDDVARVASERPRTPLTGIVVPSRDMTAPRSVRTALAAPAPAAVDPHQVLAAALSTFAAALRSVAGDGADTSEKVLRTASPIFLTLREAAVVSGLSVTYLRRRIAAQTLPATKDRSWKIRRTDLETMQTT